MTAPGLKSSSIPWQMSAVLNGRPW